MAIHPAAMEALVFAGFLGVAYAAYKVHDFVKRKEAEAQKELQHEMRGMRRWFMKHGARGILLVSAAAGHPATIQAVHEYAVHFVVYSGYGISRIVGGH